MEKRFILGQQALTPDGALYEILLSDRENQSADAIVSYLGDNSPEDIMAGSVAYYNTVDADFYPVEYKFEYDGSWKMARVLRGNVSGESGGGVVIPEITIPSSGNTYTSTVSYDDMMQAIDESSFSKAGFKLIPVWLTLPNAGSYFDGASKSDFGSGEQIFFEGNGGIFMLNSDGTYTYAKYYM